MDMTDNTTHIVEKKIFEEGKKDYASKATGNAGLTLGIIGTALGAGAWLRGNRGNGIFGSLGGNMPENVNINAYGGYGSSNVAPTALEVMEKECADDLRLTTEMFGLKLDTANKFYAMRETDIGEKFSMWKGAVEAINAENRRSMAAEFGLYKGYRDAYDVLNERYANKFNELDKEVAVLKAIRPYQDKLLMDYTDKKCCRKIDGQLVLPSTPTVTGYGSYGGCNCTVAASSPTA